MVETIEKKEAIAFYSEADLEFPIKIKDIKKEFTNQLDLIFKLPEDLELLGKKSHLKKALKKWKNNIDYYYLHLNEFESGFKDL